MCAPRIRRLDHNSFCSAISASRRALRSACFSCSAMHCFSSSPNHERTASCSDCTPCLSEKQLRCCLAHAVVSPTLRRRRLKEGAFPCHEQECTCSDEHFCRFSAVSPHRNLVLKHQCVLLLHLRCVHSFHYYGHSGSLPLSGPSPTWPHGLRHMLLSLVTSVNPSAIHTVRAPHDQSEDAIQAQQTLARAERQRNVASATEVLHHPRGCYVVDILGPLPPAELLYGVQNVPSGSEDPLVSRPPPSGALRGFLVSWAPRLLAALTSWRPSPRCTLKESSPESQLVHCGKPSSGT